MSVQPARQEDTMTVALVTFGKSGARKEFTIASGTTVIGRKTDADLRIPMSEISRAHCELVVEGDAVILRDLDSRNGTFLNDEEISEAKLKAGDRIRLGPVVFTVQINGEPKEISAPAEAPVTPQKAATNGAPVSGDAPTETVSASQTQDADFDINDLDADLDIEDISSLDLDELDEIAGSDELEEIDDLEELSDGDLGDEKAD